VQEKTREMCASCACSTFLLIEANLKIYLQLLEIAAKKKWQSIAFEKEVQYRFAKVANSFDELWIWLVSYQIVKIFYTNIHR
jgi:hypothetical protein